MSRQVLTQEDQHLDPDTPSRLPQDCHRLPSGHIVREAPHLCRQGEWDCVRVLHSFCHLVLLFGRLGRVVS